MVFHSKKMKESYLCQKLTLFQLSLCSNTVYCVHKISSSLMRTRSVGGSEKEGKKPTTAVVRNSRLLAIKVPFVHLLQPNQQRGDWRLLS